MTATAAYNRAACAETYEEVQRLIYHTVHRFKQKYGGDFEELLGYAQLSYMACYRDAQAGKIKVPFHTALVNYVWFQLFDRFRTETGHRNKEKVAPVVSLAMAAPEGKAYDPEDYRTARTTAAVGRLRDMLEELGADARAVVEIMVFDTPAELVAAAEGKGGTPRNLRSSAKQYLAQTWRWTADRIAAAFDEVEAALS